MTEKEIELITKLIASEQQNVKLMKACIASIGVLTDLASFYPHIFGECVTQEIIKDILIHTEL